MADNIEVQVVPQEQPQTISIQDSMRNDIARLNMLTYNSDEIKKFGIVITTVRDNLMAYVEVLDANAQENAQKNAQENVQKEGEPDGRTEV